MLSILSSAMFIWLTEMVRNDGENSWAFSDSAPIAIEVVIASVFLVDYLFRWFLAVNKYVMHCYHPHVTITKAGKRVIVMLWLYDDHEGDTDRK